MANLEMYGLSWPSGTTPLKVERLFVRGKGYINKSGKRYGLGYFHHVRAMITQCWPEDDHHRWSDLGLKRICENEITVFMGSSDCVDGNTRIFNPLTGENPTIKELADAKIAPTVQTLYGPEKAEVPYLKGRDDLFEIKCDNGCRFIATSKHRVLTDSGYSFVSSLRIGELLPSYVSIPRESIWDNALSVLGQDAHHCAKIFEDSRGDYQPYSHSNDGQPPLDEDTSQSFSQLQGDAQRHKSRKHSDEGDQDNKQEHIQPCEDAFPPSTLRYRIQRNFWGIFVLRRFLEGTLSPLLRLFLFLSQSRSNNNRYSPSQEQDSCLPHSEKFFRNAYSPLIHQTRIESIRKVGYGDFYDIQVTKAHHYFAEGFIHHNSNKTYLCSRFVLIDWWAHYENTLWLVSSTELRGAELRVWGKLKELFNRARARHPWLPGTVLESKHAVTTEEISDDGSEARLLTKGLIFIPCKTNNRWLGMGAYAGIKPTRNGRLGHFGDEVSFMERSFLDAYSNWYGKENFKGILTGNPTDIEDPLCTAAEPVIGWDNWQDTEKTQEWRTKFYGGWAVAFDGRDSPNLDYPADQPTKFPYLIGRKKLQAVEKTEGKDSPLWWMMCVGKPLPGSSSMKVITRQMCEQNNAYDDVVWEGSKTTHVIGLDAAYGGIGGDRCILFHVEFGIDVDGKSILACRPPVTVPVSVKNVELAETQIARFCMQYADGMGIAPDNFFFDARATLAVELARIWSPNVNAVDFGGTATKRPVSADEFVWDGDVKTKRLKRCDEHYSKFVTELWFSIRYAIMGQQIRRLPRDVAAEGAKRLWRFTKGSPPRIEVESKIEMKERTKESPDLFDALATTMEGARRLGFVIENMKEDRSKSQSEEDWLSRELDKHRKFVRSHELKYG